MGTARGGFDSGEPAVAIFAADDPLAWTYAGLFDVGDHPDELHEHHADIWECPQLIVGSGADSDAALLILSLQHEGRLGDVIGVAGRLEDVDGVPRFAARQTRRIDLGNAFYAPQVALDPAGGDALMFGWCDKATCPRPPASPDA